MGALKPPFFNLKNTNIKMIRKMNIKIDKTLRLQLNLYCLLNDINVSEFIKKIIIKRIGNGKTKK